MTTLNSYQKICFGVGERKLFKVPSAQNIRPDCTKYNIPCTFNTTKTPSLCQAGRSAYAKVFQPGTKCSQLDIQKYKNPGPGYYDPKQKTFGTEGLASTIHLKTKSAKNLNIDFPGPGTYNVNEIRTIADTRTFSYRKPDTFVRLK